MEPYLAHGNREGEVNMVECYPFMYENEEDLDSYSYLEEKDGETWAYMVSCYEITEDFRDHVAHAVTPDPYASAKGLQNSTKFRALFDGFGFTPIARLEITKAIIGIVEIHHESCMSAEGSILRTIRDESNSITFSDADQRIPYPHNRPLYITSCINGTELKHTFLYGGASINLMPLSTFKRLEIQENLIVESPVTITGFGGDKR